MNGSCSFISDPAPRMKMRTRKKTALRRIVLLTTICYFPLFSTGPKTIRIALSHAPRSSWVKAALLFEAAVDSLSKGALDVEVYHSGQLGSTREALEMTYLGAIEAAVPGSAQMEAYVEEMGLVVLPYIWKTESGMFEALDGYLGNILQNRLNTMNLHALGWFANGFRCITNSRQPIESPEDVEGLKIRVLPSPAVIAYFKAIGAAPVHVDWVELYEALKMGVVDAQENPPFFVYLGRMHEVQAYYSLTRHMNEPGVMVMNRQFYAGLSDIHRQILKQAARDAELWQRRAMRRDNAEMLDAIRQAVPVNALSDSMMDRFRRIAKETVYPRIIEKQLCGPQTGEMIQMILERQKRPEP